MAAEPVDPARVRRERDLYRQLLELRRKDEIEPFLESALALIVEVTGAGRGYLELQDDPRGAATAGGESPLFWIARGCSDDDIAAIRRSFSRGVIAEAIAGGRTIVTASALTDPRFRDRGSVRKNRIEAVLCTPIGATPPLGVLYLQDRASPGAFTAEDRLLAEDFAGTVAVFADRLLLRRRRREETDPTLPYRRAPGMDDIVGRSQALARLLRDVWVATPHDIGVLLTGPSGAGKTRIARLIHDNSPRAKAPFVELNCASLTETLLESELFGHARGAFTGADREKPGLVGTADGGTLFLDEIAEIPITSQAKLLTFLESKEYRPLGVEKTRRADVRVIAATNADLKAAVDQRTFRQDLYYRLEVMPLAVPSLAERRDDIAALVHHFCERTVEKFKLPVIQPSEGALRAAEAAEWPGNIRQLANAVQRAVVTAASEGVLSAERRHLFPDAGAPADDRGGAKPAGGAAPPATFQDATRAFQSELLRKALEESEWNVTQTAARLELTRAHVYNLIKAFGLGRRRG
jgi:Nif-specific regulatory protein